MSKESDEKLPRSKVMSNYIDKLFSLIDYTKAKTKLVISGE